MTFLPVVERELRVAARRSRTYWSRSGAVFVALAGAVWVWWIFNRHAPPQAQSQSLFQTVSLLTFAYALLAGVSATADALSQEKRDGTLGLLFLTDLKGYDVILGKLAATSLDSIYRLVAVLPVLAIPILMGGVTFGEFGRMALVLLNTLLLSLAVGLHVSALSTDPMRSALATFAWIVVLTAGPPLLGLMQQMTTSARTFDLDYLFPSPAGAWAFVSDGQYRTYPEKFRNIMVAVHGMSWLFILSACHIVRHAWQDRPASARPSRWRWRDRFRLWSQGTAAARRSWRTRALDVNPFYWLTSRNPVRPFVPWLVIGLVAAIWLAFFLKFPGEMREPVMLFLVVVSLHTLLKFWMASESCARLVEDRRTGALELLLATPLSVDEIVRGQLLGLRRQFLGVTLAVLVVDAGFWLWSLDRFRFSTDFLEWTLFWGGTAALFVVDLHTLAWLGMWHALTCRTANRAAQRSVFLILYLPMLIFLGFVTLFLLPGVMRGGAAAWMFTWFGIGAVVDGVLYQKARANLHERFREIATQRFAGGSESSPPPAPQALP